jgi:hypothetical protein
VEDILAFFVWQLFWLLYSKIWLFFQNLAIFSKILVIFSKILVIFSKILVIFSKIWVNFSQSSGHPERRTLAAYQPFIRRKKFEEIFTWKAWPACDKYLE